MSARTLGGSLSVSGEKGAPMHPCLTDWADYLTAIGCSTATAETRTQSVSAVANKAGVSPLALERRHVLSVLARCQSQWTRVTYWRSIKAFESWAREFGYAELDLTRGIPAPKQPRGVPRPIPDDAAAALLNLALSPRPYAYVRLALFQGLRVHEIAKVRGEDFDHGSNWLTVAGKGGQTDHIGIHPEVVKLADRMPELGWWFPSRSEVSEHVSAKAVSETIRNAMHQAGVKGTAHQLRHTFGTQLQRSQGNIRVTQAGMRHRVLTSTMIYTEVSDSALQSAISGLSWGEAAA